MLLTPRCAFVHIPKTGGQWVASALQRVGLAVDRVGPVHATPAEACDYQAYTARAVVFAFVRHPLEWYQSMWVHRLDEAWDPIDDPEWFSEMEIERFAALTQCRSQDFEIFVRNCTSRFPRGWVSSLYRSYTAGCTHVGRQESIVDDLTKILRDAGEHFDEELLRTTPEMNTRARNPNWRDRHRYSEDLRRHVLAVEREAVARYYGPATDP